MAMPRLRHTHSQESTITVPNRPLRILASGTVFLTHTLALPTQPSPFTVTRAHSVVRTRGGSASCLLSVLVQFNSTQGNAIEGQLIAALGGDEEGKMIIGELENEGVGLRYCKIWKGAGVPSAWVLKSANPDERTVINHNPLPDISHEEFVSLLGPLLAPENYFSGYPSPTSSPIVPVNPYPPLGSSGTSRSPQPTPSRLSPHPNFNVNINPNSPAPFDWLHFEGRSVKTTLNNIVGIDGLARERKWRNHCVFSVDVGRKGRQGVEALIPHADIIFTNHIYAVSHSPSSTPWTPRAFLLSLTSIAPPHALLVAYWGADGAAVLSVPTREYFQSSAWVSTDPKDKESKEGEEERPLSVRTGSGFWAAGVSHMNTSSEYTVRSSANGDSIYDESGHLRRHGRADSDDSQGTEIPSEEDGEEVERKNGIVDEVGAQDAFVAGMIFALSRRMLPGLPYTPGSGADVGSNLGPRDPNRPGTGHSTNTYSDDRGRWRLDECLRFATELAGRKGRKRGWDGLAGEMERAGWFEG